MELKVLDLFSGAGGFSKGIEMAGHTITKHYFSEIDKHAIANYLYNFKNAKYYGSVTDVRGRRNEVDIITFGSPCQDFSLAGKRAGMEGQRSSLILEAIRLIDEIRPSIFVWENVKGTFSSNNGADFWAIISSFANIGGYRLEWQLLNTSWFLPQNRERIYLVGHLAERSEPRVFPIGEKNENTKKEYEEASVGDSSNQGVIGYSRDSKGKILNYHKKNIANTLHSSSGIGGNTDQYVYNNKALNKTIKENNLKQGEVKALDLYNHKAKDISPTLQEPHHNSLRLYDGYSIRKLTEIECERLQGFPDDWSKYGVYDGEVKQIPRTQRYKLMGNAVTTEVVAEIFRRIKLK